MSSTTLYRFFDANDRLLYVGIAGNPGRRFNEHGKDKDWWSQVARSTMEHHPDRQAALDAEAHAIRTERPAHNVVHNGPDRHRPTHKCRWSCFGCANEIADRRGLIEVARGGDTWTAWHPACDPDPQGDSYWIAVHRIRTIEELQEWTAHLNGKRWIDNTNWWLVEAAQLAGVGYSPAVLDRGAVPVTA